MKTGNRLLNIGSKFNHLTIKKYVGVINGKSNYECQCDCGNVVRCVGKYLKNNEKLSCGCKRGDKLRENLIGKRFNRLVVIGFAKNDETNKRVRWVCQCDCGKIKTVLANSLNRGKTKSCGCLHKEIVSEYKTIKKYKDIPYTFFQKILISAKKRSLDVSISIEDIWNQYLKQKKKCFFTKKEIGFCDEKLNSGGYSNSASLDRINSELGYTKDNICLVYKDINFMKQNFSVDKFYNYCKLVVENFKI